MKVQIVFNACHTHSALEVRFFRAHRLVIVNQHW